MSLKPIKGWEARCNEPGCTTTELALGLGHRALLDLRNKGWRFSEKRGTNDADDRCPEHAVKHFQGPGTSGHPEDCGCAACRNFDD